MNRTKMYCGTKNRYPIVQNRVMYILLIAMIAVDRSDKSAGFGLQ